MNENEEKYLLLFDIDGTILSFKSGLAKDLFVDMLEEVFEDEIPEEAFPKFAGMTDLSILRAINDYMGKDFAIIESRIDEIWDKMLEVFKDHTTSENVSLMPGIIELLNMIHEDETMQLGLITGNINRNAYLKLQAHGLEKYFPFGGFGNDFEDRNSLPTIAISRANVFAGKQMYRSSNTLIIGDTWRDIVCAKSNNIYSCGVATGYYTMEDLQKYEPDLLFNDFSNYNEIYLEFKKLLRDRNERN